MLRNISLLIVLSVASSFVGAALAILIYHAPRIATVNITGMVSQFAKAESEKKHSADELKKRAQIFGSELEKNIKSIAKKEKVVVFPAEAVIDGAIDITPQLHQVLRQP